MPATVNGDGVHYVQGWRARAQPLRHFQQLFATKALSAAVPSRAGSAIQGFHAKVVATRSILMARPQ